MSFVTLLRLPLPPLGPGPLDEQAAHRLATDATTAEVVVYDLAVELARERLDNITRALVYGLPQGPNPSAASSVSVTNSAGSTGSDPPTVSAALLTVLLNITSP
jgi:hypothetical protein